MKQRKVSGPLACPQKIIGPFILLYRQLPREKPTYNFVKVQVY
jgi:hypothetical protein